MFRPIVKTTCVLVAWTFAALASTMVSGQESTRGDTTADTLVNDPLYNLWRQNPGVTQCGICHYSPTNDFAGRDTDFCALSEARQWLDQDKHAISRLRIEPLTRQQVKEKTATVRGSLSTPARTGAGSSVEYLYGDSNVVSHAICEKLGYAIDLDEGYARFRQNCLTCHAGFDIHRLQPAFERTDSSYPGIQCTTCHQLSELAHQNAEAPWIALHSRKSWRLLQHEEKATLGMRHLVDAMPQAELCTSCHIGDHSQGMFVTHEMYAAGHPPLPGFELQTYLAALPPHWRDVNETVKSLSQYAELTGYLQSNIEGFHPSFDPRETFWETRRMLSGAIKSAERTAAMIAEADDHWGDYALYDCAACHHELRLPSPRQARPIVGAPGRPRLLEWPTPLLQAAVLLVEEQAGEEHAADIASARRQLLLEVSRTPFGVQADCVPLAERLRSALAAAASTLSRQHIGAEQARQVLRALCGKSSNPSRVDADLEDYLVDYQAARQVVWAIQVIDRDLASHGEPLPVPARSIIANLGKSGDRVILSTELPSGQTSRHYNSDESGSRPGYLDAELQRIKQYDRDIIVRQLQELQNLI